MRTEQEINDEIQYLSDKIDLLKEEKHSELSNNKRNMLVAMIHACGQQIVTLKWVLNLSQNVSGNEGEKEVCDHKWNAANQCYSRCEKCGAMIRDD